MERWSRFNHQPVLPLGAHHRLVTGSKAHTRLSRTAAAAGMVLLKNRSQALPFRRHAKIAVFGRGCVDYVRGGWGSGEVTTAYTRDILDGLAEKEGQQKLQVYQPLADFYRQAIQAQYQQGAIIGKTAEPKVPKTLLEQAGRFTDTALLVISRFSGEGADRTASDFYLTDDEQALLKALKAQFAKLIVIFDVGGVVDVSWCHDDAQIKAVLMAFQGGIEGGTAIADILCGDVNPSGKLTDTFARRLEDYPSVATFNAAQDHVDYTEDIYVGYRYFETLPQAQEKVVYPFGYGLSYTTFAFEDGRGEEDKAGLHFSLAVTNTGSCSGQTVAQLYLKAPQGQLGKPLRALVAFAKTRLLQPGETQKLFFTVQEGQLASFDDLGHVQKSAWVLEKGDYHFFIGSSAEDTTVIPFMHTEAEDRVLLQLDSRLAPKQLKQRLLASGAYEELPMTAPEALNLDPFLDKRAQVSQLPQADDKPAPKAGEKPVQLASVAAGDLPLNDFVAHLPEDVLIRLTGGTPNRGIANTGGLGDVPEYGIPNVMTADGPAGVRIQTEVGVTTTAWPCATLLASTFDPELVAKVGQAAALEMKENNLGVWLAPAMDIHRSPLCGRNFEYYSEDPLLSGLMAAAMIQGVQEEGIAATPKHFACNERETNRTGSDSRVSERALREIYLKGFEIAVKKAHPWALMTSYNAINGRYTSTSTDLLTHILREEWGFDGLVMTDWGNHAAHEEELLAGNDLKMPQGELGALKQARHEHRFSRTALMTASKHVLGLILHLE